MDDGVVSVIIMGKTRVEFAGMLEDLKGKIKVLLVRDHEHETFREEMLGPGFDWGSDSVGFKELLFGVNCGEMVVGGVRHEGISGGKNTRAGDGTADGGG